MVRCNQTYINSSRRTYWVPLIPIPLQVDIKPYYRLHSSNSVDSSNTNNRFVGSIKPTTNLLVLSNQLWDKTYILLTKDFDMEVRTPQRLTINEYKNVELMDMTKKMKAQAPSQIWFKSCFKRVLILRCFKVKPLTSKLFWTRVYSLWKG